ncbi:hypothetical protein GCM10011490_01030 [Pseudoclavibacter endophyticus]|uniref:histidine kinase n=1 Tax=Pseudoclavibacter endophyticus TaxID=1778590 RepID=A0A6H9WQC6_9MICO|nr:histidine kinase [Pseudoclavibacter endophyticus]KAB1650338.1 hypothetical protein F8O04_09190 [Pseudoclavibacter endophyticus]GGA55012.1 hypothetical protein GCM10011490_01030 [Pseudoclavibacter endophyticus]
MERVRGDAGGATAPWGSASALNTSRRVGFPVDIVSGIALAAFTLPITVASVLQAARDVEGWVPPLTIGVATLLHVASLVAWRHPRAALAAGAALMLILTALPFDAAASAAMLPSSLAFLLIVIGAARATDARLGRAALAVGLLGAVGIVAAHAVVAREGPLRDDLGIRAIAAGSLAAGVIAAWALGRLARLREQRERERESARVREAIGDERRRISRDLHDVIAHSMTVMIARAEAGGVVGRRDPAAAVTALDDIAEQGRASMSDLRAMLRVLESPDDAVSLAPAPGIDGIASLVEGARGPESEGPAVSYEERGQRRHIARDAELAAHRTVQEALTNAIRHRRPPLRVEVIVDWRPGELVVAVADDGGGGPSGSPGGGRGLIGMRERVARAGGRLEIDRGAGWSVRAVLPLADATESRSRQADPSVPERPVPS